MSRDTSWWHEASAPRQVENGIKARSKRGAIGEQWWSRRFVAVLESFGMSGRLIEATSPLTDVSWTLERLETLLDSAGAIPEKSKLKGNALAAVAFQPIDADHVFVFGGAEDGDAGGVAAGGADAGDRDADELTLIGDQEDAVGILHREGGDDRAVRRDMGTRRWQPLHAA